MVSQLFFVKYARLCVEHVRFEHIQELPESPRRFVIPLHMLYTLYKEEKLDATMEFVASLSVKKKIRSMMLCIVRAVVQAFPKKLLSVLNVAP